MDDVFQDIRYAIRLCLRTPGFTAIAVLALALGIGANTAIFTLVNAVLIEPLPYRDPSRLVAMWEINAERPGRPNTLAPANVVRWLERTTAFEGIAPFYDYRVNLTGSGAPEEIIALDVTPDFFPTLGVPPLLGRTFAGDEGPDGHDAVAVLSYGLWQRRFAGDAAVVGRTLQINGRPVTVIGVMPPEAHFFLQALVAHRQGAGDVDAVRVQRGEPHAARPLHERHRTAEARRVAVRRAGADGHDRGRLADRAAAVRRRMGRPARAAPARAVGRSASRAARAHRRGRLRAADRLRQRRQPSARPRRGPAARDRHPQRARRRPHARDAPAAHREPRALRARRRARPARRAVGPRAAARDQPGQPCAISGRCN